MAKKAALDPKVEIRRFVDDQLGQLPADDPRRAKLLAVQEAVKDDDVAAVLGEGVLTRRGATRVVQEVKAYEQTLAQQQAAILADRRALDADRGKVLAYDTLVNTGALDQLKRAAGQGSGQGSGSGFDPDDLDGGAGAGSATPRQTPSMSLEEIQKLVAAQVQQVVAPEGRKFTDLLAYTTALAGTHMKEFGEALDVQALFAHCQQVGMPMDKGGYDSFVREAREERTEAHQKEHDAKIRKEAGEEAIKTFAAQHGLPYLVGGGPGGAPVASPLGLGPGGISIPEPPSVIDQIRERARVRLAEAAGKDPKGAGGMDSAAAAAQLYQGLMSRPAAGGASAGG